MATVQVLLMREPVWNEAQCGAPLSHRAAADHADRRFLSRSPLDAAANRGMRAATCALMNRLSWLVISCGLVFAACATAEGSEDSVTANTDEQPTISNPFVTQGGSSRATVMSSLDGPPGMLIEGSTALGSFAIASYGGRGGATTTVEFTVTRAAGSAFAYSLIGSGTSYGTRALRLQVAPGSDQLLAAATSGVVACGAIAPAQPIAVAVVLDTGAKKFDVLIGGASSSCSGLSASVVPPMTGFSMMDASNAGYGGRVEFSDLAMY